MHPQYKHVLESAHIISFTKLGTEGHTERAKEMAHAVQDQTKR